MSPIFFLNIAISLAPAENDSNSLETSETPLFPPPSKPLSFISTPLREKKILMQTVNQLGIAERSTNGRNKLFITRERMICLKWAFRQRKND